MKKAAKRYRPDAMDGWSEERLRGYQWRKIKPLLSYAYAKLPFYRRRFDAARLYPDAVENFQDFLRVPTFTKKELLEQMRGKQWPKAGMETCHSAEQAVLCMTSGTLGTSFLYLTRKWRSLRGDSLARAYWWAGLRPGMRMLMAAPAWHSLSVQEAQVIERLGSTCVVPWGTFLPRFAGNFLDTLADAKPDFASMFLPMLYALLAECRRRAISPAALFDSVKYLLLVGAPMTPRSREKLKEDLGVIDIFEGLGNPEGLTAMECSRHCGHHIFLDCCHVEIVDPRTGESLPPGRRGNVVITSLIPHGSIYIRYDSEDIGEILPHRCKCGKTWPLMEVYDRRLNTVQVAGKEIVPYDVRLCLDELPELAGLPFALIRGERKMDHLRLVMQKPPIGDPDQISARLRSLLQERLKLAAREEWTEELPERWKGVTVIEEKEWGRPDV